MLIDAHLHYWARRWLSPQKRWGIAWRWSKDEGRDLREAPIWQGVDDEPDPDDKPWFGGLASLGIDIGIDHVEDSGSYEGWEEPSASIEDINRRHCLAAQKYAGKLYTFIGVSPKRHNAVKIFERGVKEWGAKGLKLYPPAGFYPNEPICYRLYEKCLELGVPVTIHMGYGCFGHMKYANPVHLDEPAKDFPELEFIMAHAGGGIGFLWEEAVAVAAGNPNINFDLAEVAPTVVKGGRLGNRGKYKDHIPVFLDILDIMRNRLHGGCTRILFGTDYPFYAFEMYKGWTDLFKNLSSVAAKYGYDFSQEEADLMCYKNAVRIMKLPVEGMQGK